MKNNKLLKQTFWNFTSKIILAVFFALLLLAITTTIIKNSDFQWVYDNSPVWYYQGRNLFLGGKWIPNIYIMVCIVGIIAIFIWIYFLLKRVFSYIKALEEASKKLLDKDEEFIKLPEGLEEIESKMNELKRTALKNARMAEEQEKRKNDLIVYLAHDLKTPLTSMIGYLSLIDEIKDMPKKQREKYVSIALEKSNKLEELINELFDITRFNAEAIILEKEEIHLNRMLEQIIDDFYPSLKENEREITYQPKEVILLEGDSDKLYRVFNNILKNAIHYSTEKTIKVETQKDKNNVTIIVSNKGKKIPEEKLKRLFEKFYRADASRTSASGGSGLGLAIAKEIVELHGGNISVTSDSKSIKFYVKLPIKNLRKK